MYVSNEFNPCDVMGLYIDQNESINGIIKIGYITMYRNDSDSNRTEVFENVRNNGRNRSIYIYIIQNLYTYSTK